MIARTSIVLLLLSCFNLVLAQSPTQFGSVRAKVVDADSNQPIPFAVVYFSKTTIGGYTDVNGFVEIKKVPFGSYELIASEISHKPAQRKMIIRSEQPTHLTIEMLPKTLNEVRVTAKRDDKWNRQYERFQRLFFGTDHFKDCKIINPGLIDFKVAQGQFLAESKEPLKIDNDYLGYNMDFDMKACAFSSTTFVITGNVRFEEKQGADSVKARWQKNRENVYRGSPQHFLRSLIDTALVKEGYEIYDDLTTAASIVRSPSFLTNFSRNISSATTRAKRVGDGMYAIEFPYRLEVHYLRKRAKPNTYRNVFHAISWLEVKGNEKLIVNGDGIVQNSQSLVLLGSMSNLRVADWLPLDYRFIDTQPAEVVTAPIEINTALLEKPYIQTDRNYYYTGETMWLKGYMSYSIPMLKDTLSQSIYVELADATGKTVVTRRYHMEDGMFNGDILFTKDLKPGPYQLKAYTAWMLNFDPRWVFTKTIHVLNDREAVKVIADYKPSMDTLSNISVVANKTEYSAREKITVTIDVIDSLDFRTASDLSITVTDIVQAVPLTNEKNILTNYRFDEPMDSDTTTQLKYNIEYGIDFSGQFILRKKPEQASITVFQENTKETMGVITDEQGRFERSLTFNDTLSFYLRAMSANNKKGIVVMNQSLVKSPNMSIEPLQLDVYSSGNVRHVESSLTGAKVLKEVTIKATKIEKPQPAVIHGKGDYTVTGDWINEHNFTDIFLAIASKVPGMTYNSSDPSNSSISFRTGQFSSLSSSPPLMLVDNVAVTDPAQVRDIPIRAVERVDIIKFGASSMYGARAAGGVIAIYTKKGITEPEHQGFDKSKLQEVKVFGYSTPLKFTGPDYGNPATDDYFDYRATIYWSPFVTTDGKQPATVSFYAADVATKYRIVVEGLTKDGIPLRAEKVIEVAKGN